LPPDESAIAPPFLEFSADERESKSPVIRLLPDESTIAPPFPEIEDESESGDEKKFENENE